MTTAITAPTLTLKERGELRVKIEVRVLVRVLQLGY